MSDTISRQAVIDALSGMIDRFERILANIRETKCDDSVCGMCEYDGAYIGQSGDWCNECPGFDKDDCFKLSDECRKRWMGDIALPAVQPAINCSEFPNNSDMISRQAAIDAILAIEDYGNSDRANALGLAECAVTTLPSAQPEIIRCKDCKYREYYRKSGYMCRLDTGDPYMTGRNAEDDDWFCADAERKDDE